MALQSRKSPTNVSVEDRNKSILEFIEWVSSDDCRGLDDVGLVAETAGRLARIGLTIDRMVLHLMTLHPDVIGRSIAWAPREPVEVYDSRNGSQLPAGRLRKALEGGELLTAAPDLGWEHLDIYSGRNLTKLAIAPMMSEDGLLGVLVFGTTHPRGFDETEAALLERLVPVLRTAVELRLLKQTDLGLLDVHVGAPTAARVLARRIRHREMEIVEGALALFDFDTKLDRDGELRQIVERLDRARATATATCKRHGGEILDISASRLLAVFPSGNRADVAQRALLATIEANDVFAEDDNPVGVHVSVHFGELAYGSVGASNATKLAALGADFEILESLSGMRRPRLNISYVTRSFFDMLGDKGTAALSEISVIEDSRLAKHVKLIES